MYKKAYFFTIFLGLLALSVSTASAAVLGVSLDKDTINVGEKFTANIRIDSEGIGINAAQVTLQFPANILEITEVDRTGSIFDFWLRLPEFSNETGRLVFVGGSTSGFSGKSLQILKIVFKTKEAGNADLTFTDAAITASDGSGTNVISTIRGAQIVSAQVKEQLLAQILPESNKITQSLAATKKVSSNPILIAIDGTEPISIESSGKHLVKITAKDAAGNTVEKTVEIEVSPAAFPAVNSFTANIAGFEINQFWFFVFFLAILLLLIFSLFKKQLVKFGIFLVKLIKKY